MKFFDLLTTSHCFFLWNCEAVSEKPSVAKASRAITEEPPSSVDQTCDEPRLIPTKRHLDDLPDKTSKHVKLLEASQTP